MRFYEDNHGFLERFDPNTGVTIRLKHPEGSTFMRSFPALIDIGIMGHCAHGQSGLCQKAGIQCYQNGAFTGCPNMSFENYKRIIEEAALNSCFQVALGGRGDPDMHEDFERILAYTKELGIVVNFTTSGLGMTEEKAALCKKYCGSVAVSMYSRLDLVPDLAWRHYNIPITYKTEEDMPALFTLGDTNPNCFFDAPNYVIDGFRYNWDELHHKVYGVSEKYQYFRVFNEKSRGVNYTMKAVNMLLDAGVKTNIHYVLSNETIDEAIIRLKYQGFPTGINAVIFLLHKPVGQGQEDNVLRVGDPRVAELFDLIDKKGDSLPFNIGFDSCTIPWLLKYCARIIPQSLDSCEGARYSMYIGSDMKALPCSFDNVEQRWAVDLKDKTIKEAWNSPAFESFRDCFRTRCPGCEKREKCLGGCPICPQITPC